MAHLPAPASLRLAVFTLGWTLMVVAMMLPATLLLLRRCGDQPLVIGRLGAVILAYLAIWIVFGSLSYWGDSLLHEIVERVPSIGRVIAPCVLLLAGFLSTDAAEGGMPGQVPLRRRRAAGNAANMPTAPLGRGSAPWPVLPGQLLGADAVDVCCRWCQSGLDARPWSADDGRAYKQTRCSSGAVGWHIDDRSCFYASCSTLNTGYCAAILANSATGASLSTGMCGHTARRHLQVPL